MVWGNGLLSSNEHGSVPKKCVYRNCDLFVCIIKVPSTTTKNLAAS